MEAGFYIDYKVVGMFRRPGERKLTKHTCFAGTMGDKTTVGLKAQVEEFRGMLKKDNDPRKIELGKVYQVVPIGNIEKI